MPVFSLECEVRTKVGTGESRRLRRSGFFPAVVYGQGDAPMPLLVSKETLFSVLKVSGGSNVLVDLKISGQKKSEIKTIIRELQRDPVTGGILHIDFQHISLTSEIVVEVPVVLTGVPVGVTEHGGILEHILRTVQVECLPTDIPEKLEINVSALGVGDSIHVGDITIVNGKILTDLESALATVVPPTVFEEVKVEAAPQEPELIAKAEEEEVPEEKEEGKEAEEEK
ncbi:MAG: 50S ribosomal protein L25 [Candidatus Eisenbacteria bacterium]|nr:50S ribosomal protein L25 [Candidatus Eisenbacteria bacterium]